MTLVRTFMLLLLLTACTPKATELSRSTWGILYPLGSAEQIEAPAFWASRSAIDAVWVNADSAGIHQDIRGIFNRNLSPTVVLPLPPQQPFDQQMAPAASGLHLLWLDQAVEAQQTRLYSAVITDEHRVLRGPTPISTHETLRYTVIPQGSGSLWVIWSGGSTAEPALYAQWIDPDGRPQAAQRLMDDADWPAFSITRDERVVLFWIQPSTGQLFQGRFVSGVVENQTAASIRIELAPGERLISLKTGQDSTHVYLFWTVIDQDGAGRARMAVSTSSESAFSVTTLGIGTVQPTPFVTGFNSGAVSAVTTGADSIQWAVPAVLQSDTLPVAVVLNDILGTIYLRDGRIAGYQALTRLGGTLLRPPSFQADQDGHLTVAWAESRVGDSALLYLTSTRAN